MAKFNTKKYFFNLISYLHQSDLHHITQFQQLINPKCQLFFIFNLKQKKLINLALTNLNSSY